MSAASAAGPGSGYRTRASQIQVQAEQLDSKAHRALLDLYALDTRLEASRRRVTGLESRSQRLRAEQTTLVRRLAVTQRTLTVSQQALAEHLRQLYEQGNVDPIAVVLGAASLDDAISRLDTLARIADQRRRIVAATSNARERLVRLRTVLTARRKALGVSLAAARESEHELASARTERASYVRGLRSQARLKSAQVVTLQAAALRVERKSQEIQASSADGGGDAPVETVPGESSAPPAAAPEPPAAPSSGRTMTVSATGYALPGRTATGMPVGWGVVAVDPSVIPLGTRLTIPGYGEGVAADTGSAVRGATIDLWFPTLAKARAWGRRTVTITLH